MAQDTENRHGTGALFAGGGMLAGIGAVLGASCCVLPILLVQAGVSASLVMHLAIFAQAKPWLLSIAVVLVLAGFVAAFWGGRRPRAWVLTLLLLAAATIVASYLTPHYERFILDWIRGR